MGRLRTLVARLGQLMPLDRSEHAAGTTRPLDNPDGLTGAAAGDIQRDGTGTGGMPPSGWVKSYDEGRPRKYRRL